MIIIATTAIVILGALAYCLLATQQYQASTRLFVSTTSDGTNTQTNDGGLFAQRRVLSYTHLLTGELIAQRTIDKLGLDMTAENLQREITAEAPTDSVLIDVTVQDSSPTRARDIADTLSDEFVVMAAGLETPDLGARPNARVIVQQRAMVPDHAVAPKKTRILAVAAALGVLLGLFLAIVRHRIDDVIKGPRALDGAVGVGVIGDIPSDAQRPTGPLVAFGGARSATADAFRELRINLQSLETGDGPRVLLVASAVPQEGRTTAAVNLALALAEADYRVALVDGDLRRPRIATALGLTEQIGLATVLSGQAPLDQALQDTGTARLTAVTSGGVPPNPTELLGSQMAKDVLTALGGRFDYVIVDSPSLLVKDAAILAGHAQGVLVVGRYGQTRARRLATAVEALTRAGAPLLGAVLTMTPPKKRKPADAYYDKATGVLPNAPAPSGHARHGGRDK